MNIRILEELKAHSQEEFGRLNVDLSDVFRESFEENMGISVERMERENRISEEDIKVAKKAYSTYINAMYPNRESRFGQKDIFRYTVLAESKSSICPLWPIC